MNGGGLYLRFGWRKRLNLRVCKLRERSKMESVIIAQIKALLLGEEYEPQAGATFVVKC